MQETGTMLSAEKSGGKRRESRGGAGKGGPRVSLLAAASVVAGNMIGTGVFTSLGFQVAEIHTGFAIILLWLIGGMVALCGALSYAELAAALPRSGGEYHLLSRIFGRWLGFLSGWVSATVGFAAPMALAAMAFGQYLANVVACEPVWLSCALVVVVTAVHLWRVEFGGGFQSALTLLKVALMGGLIVAAFVLATPQPVSFMPSMADIPMVFQGAFPVAMVYVIYAYSGWNAAAYITGEVRDPTRAVPRALIGGTMVVVILYVALNMAFLRAAPMSELEGRIDVAVVVAGHLFGGRATELVALLIAFGLVSAVSAMAWTGSRVVRTMGEDYRGLAWFAQTRGDGVPHVALLWQLAVVVLFLLTSSFQAVLVYLETILILSSLLTVLGLFVLRWREPDLPRPYRAWGYPVTPALFVLASVAMLFYIAAGKPVETLAGLATVAVGMLVYFLLEGKEGRRRGLPG